MVLYRPRGLDYGTWLSNLIMQYIYDIPIFMWSYHYLKSLYGFITNTTELYRICDAVVSESSLKESKIPENILENDWIMAEARKLELSCQVLYRMDLCIFYSSKLDHDFRRQFESWVLHLDESSDAYLEPGTGVKFQELFTLICKLKKFKNVPGIASPQTIVLRAGLTEIVTTFHLLHELNKRAATRYDINVPSNEKKLLELWKLLMPQEELVNRFSTQWQKIGFQGKDPSTDFRAMGLLALDNLFYFAEKYNGNVQRIIASSHHPVSWFSFAIVGINITAYCLRLVRTRLLQFTFYQYSATKEVFNEVYCFVFDQWEQFWVGQKKPPTVMDFNRLFKQFQVDFEIHLLQRMPIFLQERKKSPVAPRMYKTLKRD